jgi:pimeloyl-ACP methyl ester carboxylesterase
MPAPPHLEEKMNPASNYRSERSYQLAMEIYNRQLARWPVVAQQRMIPTAIGETFVLSWGETGNPSLVLLHGSAANSSTWGSDAVRFGERFRVHAIDLPGETGKSTGVRPPYEGSAYIEWLSEVLDGLTIERTAVAGLSLGGWAALRFAAARPARVDRLAVLAPGGVAPARKKFAFTAAVFPLFGQRGIERVTRLVFSPQPAPPGAAEGFAFMLKHYRARRDTLPVIPDEELSRISAPALVVGGAKDALLDMPATCERLERLVPHATIHLDPALGHASLGDGDRVAGFLSSGEVEGAPRAATRRA